MPARGNHIHYYIGEHLFSLFSSTMGNHVLVYYVPNTSTFKLKALFQWVFFIVNKLLYSPLPNFPPLQLGNFCAKSNYVYFLYMSVLKRHSNVFVTKSSKTYFLFIKCGTFFLYSPLILFKTKIFLDSFIFLNCQTPKLI